MNEKKAKTERVKRYWAVLHRDEQDFNPSEVVLASDHKTQLARAEKVVSAVGPFFTGWDGVWRDFPDDMQVCLVFGGGDIATAPLTILSPRVSDFRKAVAAIKEYEEGL